MKNVILTHKELQANIYVAFLDGMCSTFKLPDGYFLTGSNERDHFTFELWKSASFAEDADAKKLLSSDKINKGSSEMNDIRPGVSIVYLRGYAQKFVIQIDEWFKEKHRKEFLGEKILTDHKHPTSYDKTESTKVCLSTEAYFFLLKNGFTPEVIV